MTCCGQGRMAWKASAPPARASAPPRAGVPLCYRGAAPVVVRGPVTGLAYSFAGRGSVQRVDARDRPGLLRTGAFS